MIFKPFGKSPDPRVPGVDNERIILYARAHDGVYKRFPPTSIQMSILQTDRSASAGRGREKTGVLDGHVEENEVVRRKRNVVRKKTLCYVVLWHNTYT